MADVKLSQMSVAASLLATDRFPFVRIGDPDPNKTVAAASLKSFVQARSSATQTASGNVDMGADVILFDINTPSSINAALGNGIEFQTKTFFLLNDVSSAILTPVNARGFTSVTLSATGAAVVLMYISGKWNIVSIHNASYL